MREFVAEQYVPAVGVGAAAKLAGAARQDAEQPTCEGTRVQLLRSIFVPEDETCIHLYSAESAEAVWLAAARAALRLEKE